MIIDFDKCVHPEVDFVDKKISTMSPCKRCKTYKEYEERALYGTIAERQYACLPDSCRFCTNRLLWEQTCLLKLAWYENNDAALNTKNKKEIEALYANKSRKSD
jgi:hypothetical protein